ncbi:hypothetical protein GGI07_002318 [Coemansia sp. Benny D115]|nr:hypothetical protein GGI07_002318 [Coemansia sp. Benny D115]
MKDAKVAFRNFDDSSAAATLSGMINKAFEPETMVNLVDYTGKSEYSSEVALRDAVWRGDLWGAVILHEGFGSRLAEGLQGAEYNSTGAVTVLWQESRHYFKVMVASGSIKGALTALEVPFAQAVFKEAASAPGASAASVIAQANPQALILPYSYSIDNIAPYHFDMSMYILSVTLSLCMVVGSFIPSNMWKTIEEPFFKQVKISQLIALRLFINVTWAFFICIQATGIVFAFSGPTWSPNAGDFFGLFGLFFLNTLAFTFFIEVLQNWVHPRFLLGAYFTTLFVNISAAIFGTELNNHFFRIMYAMPFLTTGIAMRSLLTDGSYNKFDYVITYNVLISLAWWIVSTFLIARKARLVRAGKLLMANVPPPPPAEPEVQAHGEPAAGDAEKSPKSVESARYPTTSPSSYSNTPVGSSVRLGTTPRRRGDQMSDIEIEDM